VYSGYDYPTFRWTGARSVELDLNDLYHKPFQFEPVKTFDDPARPVLVSLVFDAENTANAMP
jgi:hypothetical protein